MSYKLKVTQEPSYLHVIVTGLNSAENVASYLKEILRECIDRDCSRVLIEERLAGPRLGTMDVFQIASEGSSRALGRIDAIAYVDVNTKGDMMKFAETVAVNRGLPVTLFTSVAEAQTWLRAMDRGGTR